jgi:RimJ/RimL family protein N-acetyltransferase
MYGPVIQGKLVRLRPPRPDEAELFIGWFADMEVTRFLRLQTPPSIAYEKEWLDKMGRDPNYLIWIVEHDGAAVGATGIHEIDWKEGFGTTGTIIGDKAVWGKGLGRELMQIRTRYAFTRTPLRKLKSSYLDGNEASSRAQAATGYHVVGRYKADRFADGKWRDEILTEVMRDDWKKAHARERPPKARTRRRGS